ncbi:MAG TPA: acyltransferase, partial [Flavobacteriaceae bacterium]|nr:acyltransferase [Flavobacteriaceae bacterium]
RIARIYPLHVLTFCVMLPFFIINVWQGYFHWDIAGANLFLLQSYIPLKDFYFSINNVSWSISTELFFYLMFPFYVIWLHKFPKLKYILLLIIPIIIFAEPYFRTNMKLEKAIFYINPIVRSFDFILGIITCQIYKKIKDTPINFSKGTLIEIAAITVLAIFFYFHNDVARAFRYGIYYWIPIVGIVLIFALQKGLFSRILQHKTLVYLGEISFAFYMIHMIVIKYGNQYLPKINDFQKIGIYFVIALILSGLTFEYFEKPVAKWIKNKVK